MVSLRRIASVASILVSAVAAAGCSGDSDDGAEAADPRRATSDVIVPALAALPDGGILTGELESGVVRRHPTPGPRELGTGEVVARLDVQSGGQRGLLALAAAPDGRAWVSYVEDDDDRLVVERLAPGPRERVWTGPAATRLATGGHIAYDPREDRILIGVGDLQDPERVDDPGTLNGKLLALDPDGPAGQTPALLSLGWNNPFAFARLPSGGVVVADNAPGREPERIGRGDTGGEGPEDVTELVGRIAPSGVVALADDELAVCGVVSGTLDRFRRNAEGRWEPVGVLDDDCRYGVERLADGTLAVSGTDGVHLTALPEGG